MGFNLSSPAAESELHEDWDVAARREGPTGVMRDAERAKVYAVEDQWGQVLDRGGSLNFFDSMIEIPRQRVFPDLETIQRYVDDVLARVATDGELVAPVLVRHRAGKSRAHYEVVSVGTSRTAVIAIPMATTWARRESVVLHELAHHLRGLDETGTVRHDAGFRGRVVTLAEYSLGAEAALLLRTGYAGAGLTVTSGDR